MISALLIVALVLSVFLTPVALADDDEEPKDWPKTWIYEICTGGLKIVEQTVTGSSKDGTNYDSPYAPLYLALAGNSGTSVQGGGGETQGYQYQVSTSLGSQQANMSNIVSIIRTVMGVVTWLGILMVVIIAVSHYVENMKMNAQDPLEMMAKYFLEMIIGILVVVNVKYLIEFLLNLGTWIAKAVAKAGGSTGGEADLSYAKNVTANAFSVITVILAIAGGVMLFAGFIQYGRAQKDEGKHAEKAAGMMEAGIIILLISLSMGVVQAFVNGQTEKAVEATTQNNQQWNNKIDEILDNVTGKHDGWIFWKILVVICFIVPWALSKLVEIAATFALLSILLEIGLRKMFAPLAVANIYKDGINSQGMRYFKKFFAVVLRLALAIAISIIITMYTSTIFGGGIGIKEIFGLVALNFAGVGIMFRGGEITNDVMGV